ncbi:hypothetical protein [Bradyrhizobium sp. USDA 336]|uniref:hypothetical protein n=1 Tax=Bradyrhizobium sp. USDA 336 TaxID=3156311 RepID=UPI00383927EC
MLAQRLDDGWDIEVGVTEEILGFATVSWRSEHRTGLIVATMQQDGQRQAVIELLTSSNGAHADSLSRIRASKPWQQKCASMLPLGSRRCIGSNRSGAVERVLLMSLWRSATAEMAANSGVLHG